MKNFMMLVCVLFLSIVSISCAAYFSTVPEGNAVSHTVKPLPPDYPLEKAEPHISVKPPQALIAEPKDKVEDTKESNTEPFQTVQTEENFAETISYTEEDLYVLSHVINGEACGYSWEHQIGVGSVVLNRVKDERFPDTIKEVVFQKGQYACTWDGNYDREPEEQAIEAAKYLLENGSQMPEYTIFQSEFLQGDSVYIQIGNTYFCYWEKDKINAEKN